MRRWIGPLLALGLAVAVALISGSARAKLTLHTHGSLHPWLHLLAFALLGFAAMLSARRGLPRAALVAGLLLLAWGTEYRQHLLDGWPIERNDVQQDVIGTLCGTVIGIVARRVVVRLRRP